MNYFLHFQCYSKPNDAACCETLKCEDADGNEFFREVSGECFDQRCFPIDKPDCQFNI